MNKHFKVFFIYLPLISVTFEIFCSFFEDTNVLGVRNYMFFLTTLFFVIIGSRKLLSINIWGLWCVIYLFVKVMLSSNQLNSFNQFIVMASPLLLFYIAFIYMRKNIWLFKMSKSIMWSTALFVLSIIIFSIFRIGKEQYEGGIKYFRVGYFIFSHIYIGSISLIILPLIGYLNRSKKWTPRLTILGCLVLLILFMSLRRTSWVLIVIGGISYVVFFRQQLGRIFKFLLPLLILVIVLGFSFSDVLMKQMMSREHLFGSDKNEYYSNIEEKETRFIELEAVINERLITNDFSLMFFGEEFLNTVGNYDKGAHGDRMLHMGFTTLLHGSGIVGLFLYLIFHILMLIQFKKYSRSFNSNFDHYMKACFYALLLGTFFLLFSGGLTVMTFRLMTYLFLGFSLGYYLRLSSATNNVKNL